MRDRILLSIVGAAVVLRIAVAAGAVAVGGPGALHAPDTSGYLEPAHELVRDGTFTRAGRPEIVRTPGYSLLLTAGVAAGSVEAVTVLLQALLAGLTVVLVHATARRLYGRLAAVTAAVLMALEPLSVLYAARLLSETLFAACFTGAIYLLVRARQGEPESPPLVEAVGAGCLLAAAALTRPVAWPLVLAVALLAPWLVWRPAASARRWLPVALLSLTALAPPLAWELRNEAVAGYGGLSAIVDVNTYFYQGAATTAAAEGGSFYARQDSLGYRDLEVYLARHPEQRDWTPAERFDWMGRQGRAAVAEHPWTYAVIHLRGLARVLVDPGGTEFLRLFGAYPASGGLLGRIVDHGLPATLVYVARHRPQVLIAEGLCGLLLAGLYLMAARGLLAAPPRSRGGLAVCLTAAVYLCVAAGGPQGLSRFRHPVMPVVCVLAGAGLAGAAQSVRRPRREPAGERIR